MQAPGPQRLTVPALGTREGGGRGGARTTLSSLRIQRSRCPAPLPTGPSTALSQAAGPPFLFAHPVLFACHSRLPRDPLPTTIQRTQALGSRECPTPPPPSSKHSPNHTAAVMHSPVTGPAGASWGPSLSPTYHLSKVAAPRP